jgi:hypothetical protein
MYLRDDTLVKLNSSTATHIKFAQTLYEFDRLSGDWEYVIFVTFLGVKFSTAFVGCLKSDGFKTFCLLGIIICLANVRDIWPDLFSFNLLIT